MRVDAIIKWVSLSVSLVGENRNEQGKGGSNRRVESRLSKGWQRPNEVTHCATTLNPFPPIGQHRVLRDGSDLHSSLSTTYDSHSPFCMTRWRRIRRSSCTGIMSRCRSLRMTRRKKKRSHFSVTRGFSPWVTRVKSVKASEADRPQSSAPLWAVYTANLSLAKEGCSALRETSKGRLFLSSFFLPLVQPHQSCFLF